MKWDGIRALGYLEAGRLRLISRNDKDITVAWPELAPLAEAATEAMVLDGEIVAFDDGRPSFAALQSRMHLRQAAKTQAMAEANPVTYMIFDMLHLRDRPLIGRPYTERREILEGLGLSAARWDTPPRFDDVAHAYAESARLQLEGVVAKKVDAPYRPGRRDRSWTKYKNFRTQEVLVIGWTAGEGRRAGSIGSLLLAIHGDDGRLVYAGQVGTGFTVAMLEDLSAQLTALKADDPPVAEVPREHARNAHWVRPQLVGEVVFTEWTGDGRLRHPAWRGQRDDKNPDVVTKE